MQLTIPPKVRVGIYVANILGAPVMAYLLFKGLIGTAEVNLWTAEMAAAFLLAGLNVKETK